VLDPDGYIWQFHHIEESTIPDYIWNKYYEYLANPGEGGFVDPGTHIGNIIEWPVISFGKRFNHIHLNILGQGSKYVNGFEFHQGLPDDDVPEILQVGLLQNGQIYYGDEIEGPYSLYVHARDLVLDDVYYLPPYEVTYSVDAGPTHTVWRFDTLPGGADDEMYVEDYYVVPPTCGDYECREFYVDLGFAPFEPEAFPVDPGPHTVLVTARDYVGNQTSQTYGWTVTGGTMHVQAIALRSFGTGATRLLLSFIRAVDGEEQGVDQASMSVEWTFPNGATIEREKLTTTNGLAAFAMLSRQTGEHQICVTGLAKAGFTYEPDQNGETCDTLILP
jgi:hypothetical protein